MTSLSWVPPVFWTGKYGATILTYSFKAHSNDPPFGFKASEEEIHLYSNLSNHLRLLTVKSKR